MAGWSRVSRVRRSIAACLKILCCLMRLRDSATFLTVNVKVMARTSLATEGVMKDHGGMVDILDLEYVLGRTVDATRGKCLHSSTY
jgi:hypothetical protein